jgi:hypothetical protein
MLRGYGLLRNVSVCGETSDGENCTLFVLLIFFLLICPDTFNNCVSLLYFLFIFTISTGLLLLLLFMTNIFSEVLIIGFDDDDDDDTAAAAARWRLLLRRL